MKTWNEIEDKLSAERSGSAFPDGLHDKIMRAVREDRVQVASELPHHAWTSWCLAAVTFAAAVLVVTVVVRHEFRIRARAQFMQVQTLALA